MAIKKRPLSPRQKMINLMYVVLMAMLALNVSTEVLDGFSIVEESLSRTARNSTAENASLYNTFAGQMKENPEKVKAWFGQAEQVKLMSDSLYNFAQQLKFAIVREADGSDARLDRIKNKEDLDAAGRVMLAPGVGQGKHLFEAINAYREHMVRLVGDEAQRTLIAENLSTRVSRNARAIGKNWQEYMFEQMPVAAAVTMLSKLQSDVRHAEGEVLRTLISNVDLKDVRVNKLDAYVLPESRTVMSGDEFSARIVVAAIDTTRQPEIYVGGRRISGNTYRFVAGGVGEHRFDGYIAMRNANGNVVRRPFSQSYTVVAPSATVSADLMNVLYAGYDNPVSISIPGVPLSAVSASMAGGGFRSLGPGRYVARPSAVGQDVSIHVSAAQNGRSRVMGTFTFHVRKLPDPAAYLQVGTDRFRGGVLSKGALMGLTGVSASIDDGILDVPFRVQSFETVFYDNMGNAVPMVSDGASFSARQHETFRKLSRNKRFYINRVTAVGPDGITRRLPASMEVIVR